MKIGIVVGSVREGRVGRAVGEWALSHASGVDADVELIDLKEFDLPVFSSAKNPMMANKQYETPAATAWSAAIDACDAFVFVTAEYNHGVPGALKNAVDTLGPEWVGKAIGFVAYGAAGGVRAIEQWRQILANFSMYDVRAEVNLSLFTDFADGAVKESELKNGNLADVYRQVVAAATKLRG